MFSAYCIALNFPPVLRYSKWNSNRNRSSPLLNGALASAESSHGYHAGSVGSFVSRLSVSKEYDEHKVGF